MNAESDYFVLSILVRTGGVPRILRQIRHTSRGVPIGELLFAVNADIFCLGLCGEEGEAA